MSCTECKKDICKCGKSIIPIMPPADCNTPDCNSAESCVDITPTTCIQFTGNNKECQSEVVYETGDSIEEVQSKIVDFFCGKITTSTQAPLTVICGGDTVYSGGDSIVVALKKVTDYFCSKLTTSETLEQAILCGDVEVASVGDTLIEALGKVVTYFCTTITGLTTIPANILCGLDIVYSEGDTVIEALENLTTYICGRFTNLATVASSGDYNDLINLPTLFSGDYNDLINLPTLATVATSGDYGDLLNTPTLATVATSGNYSDLSGLPTLITTFTGLSDTFTYSGNTLKLAKVNAAGTALEPTSFTETLNSSGLNSSVHVVQLSALGSVSDVDFIFSPKGQGAISTQIPDGALTGGNKRGIFAVDFQSVRQTAATQVASGNYSFIAGGRNNTASGPLAHVEGSNNTSSGNAAHAEGASNVSSGAQAHTEGANNTASNTGSHAQNRFNTTAALDSHVGGNGSTVLAGANSGFVHSTTSTLQATAIRSAILGGQNINATLPDTVYVPNLISIGNVNTATFTLTTSPAANRALISDASGNGTWTQLKTVGGQSLIGNTDIPTGLSFFTESQNTITPNATVFANQLLATGTQPNIDFIITPKGTGALLVQIPNNLTSGGNKRGQNAVDFQMTRLSSLKVASGIFSCVLHGEDNESSGSYSYSGGSNCVSSATLSYSHGWFANARGFVSRATGKFSDTFLVAGKTVHGSTRFGTTNGSAQKGELMLSGTTLDATPLTLFSYLETGVTDDQRQLIFSLTNQAYTFTGKIIAKQQGSINIASYLIQGCITKSGTGITTVIRNQTVTLLYDDIGVGGVVLNAITSGNGGLQVQVTGKLATNIGWVCEIQTVEIGY